MFTQWINDTEIALVPLLELVPNKANGTQNVDKNDITVPFSGSYVQKLKSA